MINMICNTFQKFSDYYFWVQRLRAEFEKPTNYYEKLTNCSAREDPGPSPHGIIPCELLTG
jgi:hypothetical protein